VVAKRLGLLRELLPGAARIAVLVNPTNTTNTEVTVRDVQSAAHAIGLQIQIFHASTNNEIDVAFATLVSERPDALFVAPDPFFTARRLQLVHLATRHAVPASYPVREFVEEAGGLMSYGPSLTDMYRHVGVYTGRILKGTKPADLPVVQSNKFDLIINLQMAKLLGLEIPPTLLARADDVIE
jgi:putative tryptophan/tyrosine transport system substrate-binding protein